MQKSSWFTPVLVVFSWIGLSGLADGLVEWRDWYEIGIMQHWRSVKEWLQNALLFWLPFTVPTWLIDMGVVGAIYFRSLLLSILQNPKTAREEDALRRYNEAYRINKRSPLEIFSMMLDYVVVLAVSFIAIPLDFLSWALFWPVCLFFDVLRLASDAADRKLPGVFGKGFLNRDTEPKVVLRYFCLTLILFVPFLFIVTNELPELLDKW